MCQNQLLILIEPIFECYVVRCGFKNGYHKDNMKVYVFLKEIRLCAQNIIAILGPRGNISLFFLFFVLFLGEGGNFMTI